MVTKTKKMEQKVIEKNTSSINGNEYAPIADASVNKVVTLLLECTTAVLSQNYRIKIDDISDEMIAFGQSILKELSSGHSKMSVAEFNNKLKALYAAIPLITCLRSWPKESWILMTSLRMNRSCLM